MQHAVKQEDPAMVNREGVLLLHDNACPHVALVGRDTIQPGGERQPAPIVPWTDTRGVVRNLARPHAWYLRARVSELCGRVLFAVRENQLGALYQGRFTPVFRHAGIVADDDAGRLVFPALTFRRCSVLTHFTLIGSQDLAVTSRLNLSTPLFAPYTGSPWTAILPLRLSSAGHKSSFSAAPISALQGRYRRPRFHFYCIQVFEIASHMRLQRTLRQGFTKASKERLRPLGSYCPAKDFRCAKTR
ncbi:hypothetical protein PR048_023069 [Dryococelus australis]|uniref:Histone-lysine N-methyltransferase SETMAR n=1 Tax=Dryococelus australis TaxID=614101 RepID=A0ABQ9GT56_9NEOP|nr:hypothetical protein PR048_023069 [Dryococelus australis]